MKAVIIHNPAAGQRDKIDEIELVAAWLQKEGWEVLATLPTDAPGDAEVHARWAAGQGCDVVFVAGGDGTAAQVVDGLVGTDTALGLLPGGTGNVMARQLNLPVPGLRAHPLLDALQTLLRGEIHAVDIGRVSPAGGRPRHFLCWSGVGFDAEVTRAVAAEPERKQRLGIGAFVVAFFLTLRDFAGTQAVIRVDGRRLRQRIFMLVASNIQLYGVFLRMAPRALLDDGWLDVYSLQGRQPVQTLGHAARLLLGLHEQGPQANYYRARRVEIITARPLPVHVDGDAIGRTPAVIEVVPQALRLLVPDTAPANLFSSGALAPEPSTLAEWFARLARDAQTALMGRSDDE